MKFKPHDFLQQGIRWFSSFGQPSRPAHLPLHSYDDDVYLVSYPKSGITWLRFILGNYFSHNQCDFTNQHELMPDIHMDRAVTERAQRPRFIMSHMPWVLEYPRVVYLVRNGMDVAVSYYYYAQRLGLIARDSSFAAYLEKFNTGQLDGFGPWGNHVASWLDRGPSQFLLISYEQMKKDAVSIAEKVLRFGGVVPDLERVESAVQASTFEKMQVLEQQQMQALLQLSTKQFDASIPFVRAGKTGSHAQLFDDRFRAQFMNVHGRTMARLGYSHNESNKLSTQTMVNVKAAA